ncbi:OmpA/MotB family protein [Variovorax ginsengisoli]|uniref:OmpA family protein n=1 Tax=Variovorax ginsengisoli TaxID=363844 RepID=A0ABT8SK82_9BURK|nr:OmpA family protein [Variovorax ginsengisoli]MDN8618811.1 OmpA family protein [Variovorax ginsengisoli]MDO1537981.1 OmpA family protein [Variovorax ginsengisoli]
MKSSEFLAVCATVLAAGCVAQQTYNVDAQKADPYAMLVRQLSRGLSNDQVQITQLQNQLKVTMVNEILFPEGGWRLSPDGEQTLSKVAPTLSDLPGQQIVVEGFTDNVPIGPELKGRFPSSLDLSLARADDVAHYLVSKGVPQNAISAQGFGEARRVASNETSRSKAKNRRVEIVISAASRA